MPNSYPLQWPDGWRRTPAFKRLDAQFHKRQRIKGEYGEYTRKQELSLAQARDRIIESLRLMGVDYRTVILSSNVPVRLDGLPRSGARAPNDPGVAVYWMGRTDKTHKVIAIDQYSKVEGNMAAIAATLEAMRGIERYGGAVILERAFLGFQALPSPNNWRHVLGFEETPTLGQARERYKALAKTRHPDSGGTDTMMSELNRAMDDAERELRDKQ